ncbi:hypothetical protein [Sorangium sp. So ce426]|uniref:hypothetical protein n=1 Tax=unclassified Sorangium TaxID=2621164 RepID=UPI003F5C6F0E
MAVGVRLVEKGRKEPRHGLVEQGRVHMELARRFSAELADNGWTRDKTLALEQMVAELSASPGPAISQGEARDADAAEWSAIGRAKAFLRRLRNAVPMALRETAAAWPSSVPLHTGPLGRSAAGLSAHLSQLRPGVIALDGALRKYFKSRSAAEELDAVQRELDAASAREQAQLGDLPEDALFVSEAKGRLLELIEDLNRVGRIAFDGHAEIMWQFNKDVLLRARAVGGPG